MNAREATTKMDSRAVVALTIYLTSLFTANTLGVKLMPFFFGTGLSVAVFSFPVVFLMTDIVGEVYGKAVARQFVRAGIISIALFVVYSIISGLMPWSARGLWAQGAYDLLFGVTGVSVRMSVASLVAFAIAEYQDVFSFFFLRQKLHGKYFWIRSMFSNLWSQFWDSVIFTFVAYAGIYSFGKIWLIIVPWWLYKVAMGIAYSPLSYLGIRLLSGRQPHDRQS